MTIKTFIKNYNLAEPEWDNLPEGFPVFDISCLTKNEKIMWEIIYMAWINDHKSEYFSRKAINATWTSLLFFIVGSAFISLMYYFNANYHLGLKFLTDFFA